MAVTAVFANKGGVGKTLITANLAFALSQAGRRVLVVDTDAQCNLSVLCLGPDFLHVAKTTIDDVMRPVYRGEGYIKATSVTRSDVFEVDVLAADPAFALAEDFLGAEWLSARSGEARGINATLAIRRAIEKLSPGYDDILIDCSPMLGSTTRAALLAADQFISPVTASPFSIMGLANAASWIGKWRRAWGGVSASCLRDADLQAVPLPRFGGYVCNDAVYPTLVPGALPADRIAQEAAALDVACGQEAGHGSCLGELPYALTARLAEVRRVPFGKLGSEHGLAGAAFADRHRAAMAYDRLARTFVHRLDAGTPAISP